MGGMKWFKVKRRRLTFSLAVTIWVFLVAILAFGGLGGLRYMLRKAAKNSATGWVVNRGQVMSMSLAMQAVELEQDASEGHWKAFSRLIRAMRELENDIVFVSVRRNGITLFQGLADSLVADEVSDEHGNWGFTEPFRIRPQAISVNAERIPVVTFGAALTNANHTMYEVDLGIRRDAVQREELPISSAINSMFQFGALVVGVSFAVVLALLFWTARREEYNKQQRRQEEHLAFSGVLANGIVHDFRNPMSSLKLDLQMLTRESAKGRKANLERVGELSSHVTNTLNRMDKILQEFLFLARPASSGQMETVDLRVCIQECLDMLTPQFDMAGLSPIWTSTSNDEAFPVRAHTSSLKRAIINLLINAEQFSKKGDTIEVRVFKTKRHVNATFLDSGPGIPKRKRRQVFEMFYSTRPQGTGLGLFLAKSAIEKSGGKIRLVDSDKGACFHLSFPAIADSSTPTDKTQPS